MTGDKRYLDPMTGHGPFRLNPQGSRPNIILISTDMVPVEFHAGQVTARPHTPNIDALSGLRFANAFCTSPLCSPSRAAYLTGRHAYITTNSERAHDGHAVHLRPDDVIYPEYLRAAGYHVRHVGKCHAGAAKFAQVFGENDAPWDRWSPPWRDDDAYIAFLQRRGLRRFAFEREIAGRGLTGDGPGNSFGGWIAPQNGAPFPREATYPAYLVERAIDALEAREDGAQPFYLQLDFFGPHQPFAIPGGMEAREAEIRVDLELPSTWAAAVDQGAAPPAEPRVYDIYRRNWGLHDAATVIDYRVANQLQYELIDEMLGRLLDHLRAAGLYEDTWIFFLGDHGEMNGEWALIDKGAYLNPRVLRVPLCIKAGAGARVPSTTVDAPVSLLDLAPTVLELIGATTEARLDGVSLLATARGEARPPTLPIMADVWSHVIPNPCVGTVFTGTDDRRYQFTFNACDAVDELYCVDGDATEAPVNLIAAGGHPELLAEAVRVLHARLASDERWKSYRGFLEISHPVILQAGGDRQLFV